jgi:hypothetical protein
LLIPTMLRGEVFTVLHEPNLIFKATFIDARRETKDSVWIVSVTLWKSSVLNMFVTVINFVCVWERVSFPNIWKETHLYITMSRSLVTRHYHILAIKPRKICLLASNGCRVFLCGSTIHAFFQRINIWNQHRKAGVSQSILVPPDFLRSS